MVKSVILLLITQDEIKFGKIKIKIHTWASKLSYDNTKRVNGLQRFSITYAMDEYSKVAHGSLLSYIKRDFLRETKEKK